MDYNSEEEDFQWPAKKKMRKDAGEEQLDTIIKAVSAIKESVADMMSPQQSKSHIRLGLLKIAQIFFNVPFVACPSS